jgi:hypothetical protein
MQRIQKDSLVLDEEAVIGVVEKMQAQLGGDQIMLMDINKIEQEIVGLPD